MAVYIDEKLCKGCGLCVSCCSRNVFEIPRDIGRKGFSVVTAPREDDCVFCGLCEKTCPDLAIRAEDG